MVFATDLDGTMIFSHRLLDNLENKSKASIHCVEIYNDKPITFMTDTAIKKLEFLISRIHVIPVTTRSVVQLQRVKLFTKTEYAIADNGGVILHNGVIDTEWETHINTILEMYDLQTALKVFNELPDLSLKPKIVDNCFVFTKSNNIELCKKILPYKIDTKKWQISFQNQSIYHQQSCQIVFLHFMKDVKRMLRETIQFNSVLVFFPKRITLASQVFNITFQYFRER